MNSLLIAYFDEESSARSAMKKLDDLALNGSIDLYQRTLVRKTPAGRFDIYREGGSAGWRTITGALAGSFLGLAGGPIGFAAGLVSGAVVGSAITDREQHDFGEVIKTRVEKEIPPGKVAIVAHIGEKDPELVDSLLRHFDSFAVRSSLQID